jgi:4-hydroxy-2-oxoheptanedioate aldolase
MTANVLRALWHEGKTALGTFVTTPSAWIAELLAHQGYDTLLIDKQHGLIDLQQILAMLRGASSGRAVPLVRVAWADPAEIMQCLDAGAAGIVCPMISHPEEATRFVQACRYPPQGYRSLGPIRAGLVDPEGYGQPLTFAMIETAGAMEHLDRIAATPGLDGLFVGPWDLTISMGLGQGADFSDEKLLDLLRGILNACQQYGLVPGIFAARVQDAIDMQQLGFRYIIQSDDSKMLGQAAKTGIKAFRDAVST